MTYSTDLLNWQETMNSVTIDCSLDIGIHPADTDTVFLIVPGVDGSVNGYKDKYIRMAERVQAEHNVAVVRIANPFVSSFHWESNFRRILDYIERNASEIIGSKKIPCIKVMAHSAGASIVARIAHEYGNITDILLVNPAQKLGADAIRNGLKQTSASVTVIFGEKDPSVSLSEPLQGDGHSVVVLEGVDHNFSGDFLTLYIDLPREYLF